MEITFLFGSRQEGTSMKIMTLTAAENKVCRVFLTRRILFALCFGKSLFRALAFDARANNCLTDGSLA